jgi:hypothetical protein
VVKRTRLAYSRALIGETTLVIGHLDVSGDFEGIRSGRAPDADIGVVDSHAFREPPVTTATALAAGKTRQAL